MNPEIFIKRLEKVVINGVVDHLWIDVDISFDIARLNFSEEIVLDPNLNLKKNVEAYLSKKILEMNDYTDARFPGKKLVTKIPVEPKSLSLDLDKIASTKKVKNP